MLVVYVVCPWACIRLIATRCAFWFFYYYYYLFYYYYLGTYLHTLGPTLYSQRTDGEFGVSGRLRPRYLYQLLRGSGRRQRLDLGGDERGHSKDQEAEGAERALADTREEVRGELYHDRCPARVSNSMR